MVSKYGYSIGLMPIVSHISKAQKGMSEHLQNVWVEISVQEAFYIVLQRPVRISSHQVIFINTLPLQDRVYALELIENINWMEGDP